MTSPRTASGPTRKEKKRRQERVDAFHRQREALLSQPSRDVNPTQQPSQTITAAQFPSGTQNPAAARPGRVRRMWNSLVGEPNPPGWEGLDTGRFTFFAVAISIAAIVTIGRGTPVLGHGVNWPAVGSGLVATAAVAYLTYRWLRRRVPPPGRVVVGVGGLSVLVVAAFAWGATHSVVIDGTVYTDTSETARAWRLTEEIEDNLEYFGHVDELLALGISEARARFGEFEPAIKEMEAINDRWATTDPASLPSGEFAPVVENMEAAAYSGLQSLDRAEKLVSSEDAKEAAERDSFRASFVEAALAVGPALNEAREQYGFDTTIDYDAVE